MGTEGGALAGAGAGPASPSPGSAARGGWTHRAALTAPPGTRLGEPGPHSGQARKRPVGQKVGSQLFVLVLNLYVNIDVPLKARMVVGRGVGLVIDSDKANVQTIAG